MEIPYASWHSLRIAGLVGIAGTSVTGTITEIALCLGYFIGMTLAAGSGVNINDLVNGNLGAGWEIYLYFSILLPVGALTIIMYWKLNDWSNHPTVKDLCLYKDRSETTNGISHWRIRASEIANEFRRIDKYTTSYIGWSRVIVTENWIIVTSLYSARPVRQDKVTLAIMHSDEHDISPESYTMVQYLHLRIKPTIKHDLKPFYVRILSMELKELRDAANSSILTLPNIAILQTVDELFLKAFREQVSRNTVFQVPTRAEQCIGCMQNHAEVKLIKNCESLGQGACNSCECRPLWCIDCMGRWYASRQDRSQTDTWLSGNATCPMCRAKFCMLDISLLDLERN